MRIQTLDPRFPDTDNLLTHGLHQLDSLDLLQGFHHGKSQTLVNRNPDSAIPDEPIHQYGPLWVSPPRLDLLGPYDLPLYDRSHTTYRGFRVSNADKHFPTGLPIPQILIL
jgi:hypothetical protein